jgi:DNA-directed RNA polymerase subunit RPC12/RpoP
VKKQTAISILLVLAAVLLMPFGSASAQEEEPYQVSLRRDFGYGNGMDIQGRMTLSLKGDDSAVRRVTFLMDGELLISLETRPYSFSFTTDDYASGVHKIAAKVETIDGKVYITDALTYNFLSKEAANQNTRGIILPLVVLIVGIGLLSLLLQRFTTRKISTVGENVSYNGLFGGAVCSKCGKPFARSIFGMNLIAGRLERCPHCGKWVLTHRASAKELDAAAAAERASVVVEEKPMVPDHEAQNLLDDSRYYDPNNK